MCPASRPMAPPNSVLASIPKWTSCSAIKPSMSLALDVPLRGLSSRAILKFLFDDEDLAMCHSLLFGPTVRLENLSVSNQLATTNSALHNMPFCVHEPYACG